MKADHVGSLEYFEGVGKEQPQQEDFGAKIRSVKDKAGLQQIVQGPKPAVVEFYAPWCAAALSAGYFNSYRSLCSWRGVHR